MTETVLIGQEPELQPEVDVSKIVPINRQSFGDKLRAYAKKPFSMILMLLVMLAALVTAAIVIFIVVYTLAQGIPNLKGSLFAWNYNSDNVSMTYAIINTLFLAGTDARRRRAARRVRRDLSWSNTRNPITCSSRSCAWRRKRWRASRPSCTASSA